VVDIIRIIERSTNSKNKKMRNKMNQMVTQSLQRQLDLEANQQVIER
jgi:hypothetical protein